MNTTTESELATIMLAIGRLEGKVDSLLARQDELQTAIQRLESRVHHHDDHVGVLERRERLLPHRSLKRVARLQESGGVDEDGLVGFVRVDPEQPLPGGL